MKVNEQWLREWVNPDEDVETLTEQLTMAGLELDALDPVSDSVLDKVVIGQVSSIKPHPDADKLRVCQVDVGGEDLSIVCGAANVKEGGVYPVATKGAVLPNGLKIKPTKLRGVPSAGMLCSTQELGMTESAEGLFTLPEDAPVGDGVYDYLRLNDNIIEIGLTPNRGDCLSVRGIAREASVLTGAKLSERKIDVVKPQIKDSLKVALDAPQACARYVGRIIKGVNPQAQTPLWMQERLRRCGLRSISPIVDVTNYVLLELGQPMHAFDLAKLQGGIVVRYARPKEKLTLLDGQEIKLSDDSLVIADEKVPLALAGIMGGADSAVGGDTQDILLESAYFDPLSVAGKARQYGLHTDSSHRFERGVDYDLQKTAMERATQLVLEIVGGKPGPVIEQVSQGDLPKREAIELRHARIGRVLGAEIDKQQVQEILTRLQFKVKAKQDSWSVVAPSFRFDIEKEIDLIEEVARVYGYHNIPETTPHFAATIKPKSEAQLDIEKLEALLVGKGYQEAVTYSFVDPVLQAMVDGEERGIPLHNPISADMSVMRTSLWPGLLQAAVYNNNRQQDRIRMFETGLVFNRQNGETEQCARIAGLIMGRINPEQWAENPKKSDFFDAKNDVEALLGLTGMAEQFSFKAAKHPALHPGQSASVHFTDENGTDHHVGWLGTLYPSLQTKLGLTERTALYELNLGDLLRRRVPVYQELSKFPAIRRDLAIVVDETITMDKVSECVKKSASELLKNLQLFDEYRGKGIDSGRKSLAFGITLQDQEKTLTDGEVDTVIARLIASLEKELGATLRE